MIEVRSLISNATEKHYNFAVVKPLVRKLKQEFCIGYEISILNGELI